MGLARMLALALVLAGIAKAAEGGNTAKTGETAKAVSIPVESNAPAKDSGAPGKAGAGGTDRKALRAKRKQAREERHAAMAKAREQAIEGMRAEMKARRDAETAHSSASIEANQRKAEQEKTKEKGNAKATGLLNNN
jgi:hypothetical protein